MKIRPAWQSVRITLNIDIDGPDSVVIGFPDQLPAASIWFEIWGVVDPGEKISIFRAISPK